jgi:hypothetical protein
MLNAIHVELKIASKTNKFLELKLFRMSGKPNPKLRRKKYLSETCLYLYIKKMITKLYVSVTFNTEMPD